MSEAVAVIADPHYHDVDYRQGVGRRRGGAFRTLADTVDSTRVFNESHAALPALLDDIAARGIRLVAVLGDLSDDGQASTMRAATELLRYYEARHGLRFFATPGNHDLFAIHGRHQGKRFLDPDGGHALVTSDPRAEQGASAARIVSPEMYCGGYEAALGTMADFGFFRRAGMILWETPFGPDDALAARTFEIRSADGATVRRMVDASYLVEPVPGLWLLSIDANVFEPRDGGGDPAAEASYIDSTDAGWNAMVRLKPFVLDWMADVAARAQAGGKRLLAFSHYPVLNFLSPEMAAEEARVFGETSFARRAPRPEAERAVAATGIGVHFSGHLHVNDTTVRGEGSDFLVNVAVPSTVAFPSGYKIVRFEEPGVLEIETISLGEARGHDAAFGAYRTEAARTGSPHLGLATAASHGEFLCRHLEALVAERYLPREWPEDLVRRAETLDLAGLCRMVGATVPVGEGLGFGRFVSDWYRLRKGRDLAAIPPERVAAWLALDRAFAARVWPEGSIEDRIAGLFRLFRGFALGAPSRDFRIDLGREEVSDGYRGRTERLQTGAA